jgi:hypothetical protein
MAKKTTTNRRDFLKLTAAGAAGIALTSQVGTVFAKPASVVKSPLNKWPGRVVFNFNKAALSGTTAVPDVIKTMVDDSIKRLTDQSDVGAAWKALFPDTLGANSKIAIKLNTRNAGLPAPHWSSVRAITDGLQLMTVGGAPFSAANITLFDMYNGGQASLTQAGYTAANFPGVNIVFDTPVDGGDGALNNRTYAKTLKDADFLINVFSPRGHSIPPAGSQFSLGFKSHYGTYSDPSLIHDTVTTNIREMVCKGPVYAKSVLSVCSGIYGMNEGNGPTGNADIFKTYAQKIDASSNTQCPTTIILTTDPISAEMQSIKILRMNKGGAFGVSDMPPYLKASAGIDADGFTPTYNIGVIDEAQMDVRRIINGQIIAVKDPTRVPMNGAGTVVSAHQIKGHSTFIEFSLPKDHFGKEAKLEIFDLKGSLTRSFSPKVMGMLNHLSWDEKDTKGALVSKGAYIVRLSSGTMRESSQFSIVR